MATANLPRDDMVAYLKAMERRIAILEQRSPLANTGMSVPGPGEVDVDGTLNVTGPLTVGGTASFSGNTTIGGNAAITGTLSLPNGIINNDALASPVNPQAVYQTNQTGFALSSSSWVEAVGINITAPSGFTQALISMTGLAFASNPNTTGGSDGTGNDYLECYPQIADGSGSATAVPLGRNGGQNSALTGMSALLTNETAGASSRLKVMVSSGFSNIASQSNSFASLWAIILWLR